MTAMDFKIRVPRLVWIIIAILAIAALAIFVAWPRYKTQSERAQVVSSYDYTYKNLEKYQVNGLQPHTGMSFEKPVELKSTLSDNKAPVADLTHYFGKNKIMIADIAAYSQPRAASDNKQSVVSGSNLLPVEQFVAQRLSNLKIQYKNPRPLTTPNLKDNAWRLDFTTQAQTTAATYPQKKGVVILTAGQKVNYYFLIDALNKNWVGNQAVWQKVIDSIKVDQ